MVTFHQMVVSNKTISEDMEFSFRNIIFDDKRVFHPGPDIRSSKRIHHQQYLFTSLFCSSFPGIVPGEICYISKPLWTVEYLLSGLLTGMEIPDCLTAIPVP